MKPDYIAFLTLRVYSGTPLHDWIASGEFKMMEPPELMRETRLFLEHIDSDGSIFRSNHASNYLPLGGTLNRDREALIHTKKGGYSLSQKENIPPYTPKRKGLIGSLGLE